MAKKNEAVPLYRRIISDAWRIAWVHKHLWIFGFFATFLGFGGVSEVLFGIFDQTTESAASTAYGGTLGVLPGIATIKALLKFSPYPSVSLTVFTVIVVFFFTLFIWVVSTAIGGLIHSIKKVERGSEPKFAEGLKAGSDVVGRVFAVNILAKAVVALAFFLTGANLVLLLSDGTITSGLFYLGSYVLFTIIALMAAVTAVYATNYAVLENMPFEKAWPAGWKLTKENWLISLEMVIVLMLVNFAVAVVALLAAMVVSIPLIFLFALAVALQAVPLMTVLTALTAVALITVIVLIGSFMTTFQVSAWYLLWQELTGSKPTSRLIKAANYLKNSLGL